MVQRKKLRDFTGKENVGATNFAIDSINASRLEAPLAGGIAELIIFKQKSELDNASTIKRIQKHFLDEYDITHEPILSMQKKKIKKTFFKSIKILCVSFLKLFS